MNIIFDGGSAFPNEHHGMPDGTWNETFESGMSLRDWFAGQALCGILSATTTHLERTEAIALMRVKAESAYELADAMLKARTKSGAA